MLGVLSVGGCAGTERNHQSPDPVGVCREPGSELFWRDTAPEREEHDVDQDHPACQEPGQHRREESEEARDHAGTIHARSRRQQVDPCGVGSGRP